MVVSRLVSVLLGMGAFGRAVSAQVESTGFETADGWVAGYSICGPEFAATCSYPITNVCVPNDHVANQNCCELDPNVNTGWYMGSNSQHCNEPHIDTIHPFSGLQHLRFQRDAAGGNPPGCIEFFAQCDSTAFSPRLPAQSPQRTVVSLQVAGTNSHGSSLFLSADATDDPHGSIAAWVLFNSNGSIGLWDRCDNFFAVAPWPTDSVYRNFTVELDPSADKLRYCAGGNTVLSTTFVPDQARTVQGAAIVFESNGGPTIWDIDDFSITRGTSAPVACREFPSECQTPCGPRPCAVLKAVAINGEPIPPSTDVHVRPGDLIESEIYFSGWGGNIPEAGGFQVDLRLYEGATSGTEGTVLPLGWDAPLEPVGCATALNCPPAYPICSPVYGRCVGPNHSPMSGAYIDIGRPDYLFVSACPELWAVDVSSLHYRYAGFSCGQEDAGFPRYAGTLFLVTSEDACGTFTFRLPQELGTFFQPLSPIIFDTSSPPVVQGLSSRSLVVRVCEDDGLFCNGTESCDAATGCRITDPPNCDDGNECTDDFCDEDADACGHVTVCGACCDSWNGDCQNAVAQADCSCTNCVWTGGAECADIECKAEFVPIPTVSQWGLVVLTLLLLTGGKVMFGHRSTKLVTFRQAGPID